MQDSSPLLPPISLIEPLSPNRLQEVTHAYDGYANVDVDTGSVRELHRAIIDSVYIDPHHHGSAALELGVTEHPAHTLIQERQFVQERRCVHPLGHIPGR